MINDNQYTVLKHESNHQAIVLVPTVQEHSGHWYQLMGKKYLDPLVHISGCVPVMLPQLTAEDDIEQYLDMADAIFLSGASTNIDLRCMGKTGKPPIKVRTKDG